MHTIAKSRTTSVGGSQSGKGIKINTFARRPGRFFFQTWVERAQGVKGESQCNDGRIARTYDHAYDQLNGYLNAHTAFLTD